MTKTFAIRRVGKIVEMVVTGRWTPEAFATAHSTPVDRLVLNYALGFEEPDLDFIRGLPVRQLQLIDRKVTSLAPLYNLSETLETIDLSTNDLEIDVSRFPHLISVAANWQQVHNGIGGARGLRSIFINNYQEADLSPLSSLEQIQSITLKDRPKLRSINGLKSIDNLISLTIVSGRHLEDISALESAPGLKELELEECPRLKSLDSISHCFHLKFLNISDCGEVESLQPIASLSNLEAIYLYGTTKIADGDLSPLIGLPLLQELRMQNRRHYSISVSAIQKAMESRKSNGSQRSPLCDEWK